jgi:hypothetical protein
MTLEFDDENLTETVHMPDGTVLRPGFETPG